MAKDCVDWASVINDSEDGEEIVVLDFSDLALLNHSPSPNLYWKMLLYLRPCWSTRGEGDTVKTTTANVAGRYDKTNGRFHVKAIQDIKAGEELLIDYSKSAKYDHKLKWFNDVYEEYYPDRIGSDASELKRWS